MHIFCYFFNHYTAHNTLPVILIRIVRILNLSIKKQIIFAKKSDFKVWRAVEDDLNVTEFVGWNKGEKMAPSIITGIYLPLTCTIKIRINGKFILNM